MDLPILDTILIPVDGSESSRMATRYAVALATKCEARVVLFYARPLVSGRIDADDRQKIQLREFQRAQVNLNLYQNELDQNGVPFETVIGHGAPANAILEAAREHGCEMIVMGAHKQSWIRKLIGSTAGTVSAHSPVPVFVISTEADQPETQGFGFMPVPHLQKTFC